MEIFVNGQSRTMESGATIARLLTDLELPREQVAVERNERLVPRRDHEACQLVAGDRVEIVTLVGGG